MYHGNAETRKQREFREQVQRNIERAAKLNQYLQGRLERPSPSTLYRPPHGGYPSETLEEADENATRNFGPNEDGAGI